METEPDSCNVCGGTDTKLIDGFYYCIECGTQNTNVRETVIEEKALGDGTFAQSNRRKIVQLKKDGIEMSGEWYRWHAFNFIISGLADELVSLGAKATFKTKLLWIWIRYIKKYQNKSELMMNKTTQGDGDQTGLPSFMAEEDSILEAEQIPEAEEISEENNTMKRNKCDITEGSRRDIKFLSKGVIMAMLYLALNLDESEIQLSHLYRFIQEKHLNISDPKRFVPDEINVKKIPEWLNFVRSKLCTPHQLRALAMSLLRKLNLGTPKVPDLNKIAGNFLTELCLPNDMRPFIYSLMHFRKCNFLDIDNNAKKCLIRIPDYEGTVMTYILVAIKICFGLDDKYEIKLSNTVEKMNEDADRQKSYKIGKYSEPTDRLFSFREWCSYIQFRKIMLSKYNLRIAEKNCLEIDDYVYLEQMEARPINNEELPDKISMEIISRLPQEHNIGVIPKEFFVPTLTPMTEFTDIVIEHCQDPEVKLMLAEDFKRYSLKYVCENLELLDADMENSVKGVNEDSKDIENNIVLGTIVTKKAKTNMVYVKNCENRNWLKTKPPTMEHITCEDEVNEFNDKEESDHGYDSENASKENDVDSIIDSTGIAESVVDETLKDESPKEVNRQVIITEEDLEVNIFDDDFTELDLKEECERSNVSNHDLGHDENEDDAQIQTNEIPDEDFDRRSNISDDLLLPVFNPETFDKEKTIKELILFACSKYKIPVPSEYKTKETRKRKDKTFAGDGVKKSRKAQYVGKVTVKELLTNYYNNLESDFVNKVQQEMSLSIRNAELDSMNLEQDNDISNLHIGFVETNSANQSDRNSPIGQISDENFNVDDTTKTDLNDKADEFDENTENKLFLEDAEMNLDDLITKGDPEFDERKYDIDQLYLKIEDKQEEVLANMSESSDRDPELDEIIQQKIEEFKKLQPETKKDEIKKKEESDSEDEIPLSVLKEEALLIEEKLRQEENYENLIEKEDMPEYKYWIRHYDPDFMLRSTDWHTKFDEELKENTPTSFYFVIQECASILNCTNFYLYKNMQSLEGYLMCKAKNRKDKLKDFLMECSE